MIFPLWQKQSKREADHSSSHSDEVNFRVLGNFSLIGNCGEVQTIGKDRNNAKTEFKKKLRGW
jgi:hypothetical protein